jgi:predicted esterase
MCTTLAPAADFPKAAVTRFDIREAAVENRGAPSTPSSPDPNVVVRQISFANASFKNGPGRTEAYLILPSPAAFPAGKATTPAALFVHWYESESPTSNRTQFLNQAMDLARGGLVSLLVSTPWSEPEWYKRRDVTKDFQIYDEAAKNLERALDVLAAYPGVDPKRLALVGHDYGAMHGILAAVRSKRLFSAIALQAFAPRFSDWAMFGRKLTPEERQAVVEQLAPLDPVKFLGQLTPATPVFLQFANEDFYVPKDRAETLVAAVKGPKKVGWYEGKHALDQKAVEDRQAWLREVMKLKN